MKIKYDSNIENCKKYKLKKVKMAGLVVASTVFLSSTFYSGIESSKNNIYKEHKEEIISYDENLEKYAAKYDTDKMSNMEIIMSVMNDIRSNTRYGINDDIEEINGYGRLVLDDSNDIGVCRHMADKFTTTMNMINPEFEAFNLCVYLNTECKTYTLCNIDRPFYDDVVNNDEENSNSKNANHMVTVLKPIGEECFLVVDVTNPSIGVINDGNIYMFNTNDYTFIEYRPIAQFIMSINNSFSIANKDIALSYIQNIDLDKLNDEYGLENQNKVLENIKKD